MKFQFRQTGVDQKGTAIPGTPSGVNHSSEIQKRGRKSRRWLSSSEASWAI
jgi:hypothetical protein